MKGILYIVSTPIGNLEDITLRALRILKEVDVIAAEDTRHSLKLLSHYGISKTLISYWKEKEKVRTDEIVRRLHAGQSVALISDAGTPGISDPGTFLIKRVIDEGIKIIPVPGPSACIAALSVSGLPTGKFTFTGFLPAKGNQRRKVLQDLQFEQGTLIFYEAPHRVLETLEDMKGILGERNVALIKEITKLHEDILRGGISRISNEIDKGNIVGEYVIIVEGRKQEKRRPGGDILREVFALMKKGIGRKEAVRKIADAYGISKKELYDESLNEIP